MEDNFTTTTSGTQLHSHIFEVCYDEPTEDNIMMNVHRRWVALTLTHLITFYPDDDVDHRCSGGVRDDREVVGDNNSNNNDDVDRVKNLTVDYRWPLVDLDNISKSNSEFICFSFKTSTDDLPSHLQVRDISCSDSLLKDGSAATPLLMEAVAQALSRVDSFSFVKEKIKTKKDSFSDNEYDDTDKILRRTRKKKKNPETTKNKKPSSVASTPTCPPPDDPDNTSDDIVTDDTIAPSDDIPEKIRRATSFFNGNSTSGGSSEPPSSAGSSNSEKAQKQLDKDHSRGSLPKLPRFSIKRMKTHVRASSHDMQLRGDNQVKLLNSAEMEFSRITHDNFDLTLQNPPNTIKEEGTTTLRKSQKKNQNRSEKARRAQETMFRDHSTGSLTKILAHTLSPPRSHVNNTLFAESPGDVGVPEDSDAELYVVERGGKTEKKLQTRKKSKGGLGSKSQRSLGSLPKLPRIWGTSQAEIVEQPNEEQPQLPPQQTEWNKSFLLMKDSSEEATLNSSNTSNINNSNSNSNNGSSSSNNNTVNIGKLTSISNESDAVSPRKKSYARKVSEEMKSNNRFGKLTLPRRIKNKFFNEGAADAPQTCEEQEVSFARESETPGIIKKKSRSTLKRVNSEKVLKTSLKSSVSINFPLKRSANRKSAKITTTEILPGDDPLSNAQSSLTEDGKSFENSFENSDIKQRPSRSRDSLPRFKPGIFTDSAGTKHFSDITHGKASEIVSKGKTGNLSTEGSVKGGMKMSEAGKSGTTEQKTLTISGVSTAPHSRNPSISPRQFVVRQLKRLENKSTKNEGEEEEQQRERMSFKNKKSSERHKSPSPNLSPKRSCCNQRCSCILCDLEQMKNLENKENSGSQLITKCIPSDPLMPVSPNIRRPPIEAKKGWPPIPSPRAGVNPSPSESLTNSQPHHRRRTRNLTGRVDTSVTDDKQQPQQSDVQIPEESITNLREKLQKLYTVYDTLISSGISVEPFLIEEFQNLSRALQADDSGKMCKPLPPPLSQQLVTLDNNLPTSENPLFLSESEEELLYGIENEGLEQSLASDVLVDDPKHATMTRKLGSASGRDVEIKVDSNGYGNDSNGNDDDVNDMVERREHNRDRSGSLTDAYTSMNSFYMDGSSEEDFSEIEYKDIPLLEL